MPLDMPPPPPGIHSPAPGQANPKSAENYGQTKQASPVIGKEIPYVPYATSPITSPARGDGRGYRSKHTNRLHSRKQAKQRASRKASR
jgi:hypothetical protein